MASDATIMPVAGPNQRPRPIVDPKNGASADLAPDATIMPIVNPNPKPGSIVESDKLGQGASGTPLLTAIPQIARTAHSSTVNARAAQTGPAAHSNTVSADAAQTGPADLVENRIGGIIDANSPLMQLAASRANQRANDRGLLSSSMAVGDAQKAVLDAATPIASQDAQAINQTNQFNTSNQQQVNLQNATQAQRTGELNAASDNQTSQFNAANQQQTSLQNATQAQRTSELNAASENKSAETNIENAMRTNLANLDVSTRKFMADMEQKNKQLIQSSANAATLFNTFQQQVSAIMTSPNITGDSNVPDPNNPDRTLTNKELAIRNLQSMLQDSLAAQDAISGLDLSSIIGIESGGGTGNETGNGTVNGETGNSGGSEQSAALAQWQSQVNGLQEQVSNLENNPPDGGSATTAAYRRRLQELKAQLRALMSQKPA